MKKRQKVRKDWKKGCIRYMVLCSARGVSPCGVATWHKYRGWVLRTDGYD